MSLFLPPPLSDVNVHRLVDTGSKDNEAYTNIFLWFLASNRSDHILPFGGYDEVGVYIKLTFWYNTIHAETFQFYPREIPLPTYAERKEFLHHAS